MTILFLSLLAASLVAGGAMGAPRIHVRGQARLEAQAARDSGELLLTGGLADDAGQPLVNEALALTFMREGDAAPLAFSDLGNVARGCNVAFRDSATPGLHPSSAGGPLVLQTDEAGRFCVRLTVPRDRYVATFAWGGTGLVDGAKLDVPVDTGRQAIALRFEPVPWIVSLDKTSFVVEILASHEENGTTRAGANLVIHLTNERGEPLGSGTTSATGSARITVPGERLGPPGRGALQAAFLGNDEFTRSVHSTPIERHARVEVIPADVQGRRAASPEDGIPVAVAVTTKLGAVPTGSVEAIAFDSVVGAAPIENGTARVVATFSSSLDRPRSPESPDAPSGAEPAEVELRLRYMPSAPWFEPGDPAIVKIPVKGPSPLRQVPLALAGIAVVLWLLAGRLKRTTAPTAASIAPPKGALEGEARIDVVRATRDARAGWSGRVIDAHDGTPVRGARVRIERPGFDRAEVVASVHANEMGRFELRAAPEAGAGGPGDELVVEGPLHTEIRQPVPPCGEIDVALVLRKRKLIERLVGWAKKRGRPFDASPEPTPGQVRRAAGADFATARWADAVERAAYGGGDVDARIEADVERLAPEPTAGAAAGLTVRDIPPGSGGGEAH